MPSPLGLHVVKLLIHRGCWQVRMGNYVETEWIVIGGKCYPGAGVVRVAYASSLRPRSDLVLTESNIARALVIATLI